MSRLVISALNLGLGAVLAVGLTACNRDANADGGVGGMASQSAAAGPKYARVVSVTPVREQASAPQQVCHDEVVTQRAPVKDQHQIAGTAIGAVAGGLLGNQIGGGRGRTAATVGGAVLGAVAGNQVEKRTGNNTTTVYRVNVRLDDGRMATVTQRDIGALRVGDRARVANDMAMPY